MDCTTNRMFKEEAKNWTILWEGWMQKAITIIFFTILLIVLARPASTATPGRRHCCPLYGGFHITPLCWNKGTATLWAHVSTGGGIRVWWEPPSQQNRSLTWQSGDLHLPLVPPKYSSEPFPSEPHFSPAFFFFFLFFVGLGKCGCR